jgi:sarcosine oxidase
VKAIGIDRFAPPHTMGSSHGETRITRLAVGEGDAYAPIVRRSHDIWRELEAESGQTLMLQTGGLIMAPQDSAARHHGKENFLHRSFAMAEKFGIPHERLGASEIAARYPQFQLRGDELGYFEPSAGLLRPETCVATALRLAGQRGAVVRFNERVQSVVQNGAGVNVRTDAGVVSAGRVVLTAGPWVAGLLPTGLRPLARVYRQVLHWFEPQNAADYAVGQFPIFIWMHGDREEDYFYGFPTMDDASGVKVATESYERDVDPDTVDRSVAAAESAAMYNDHVASRLRNVGAHALRSAACLYTVTPDSGFIVDDLPGQDRVLAVSACSGHGFKHSAALGEAIAQRLVDGQSAINLAPFGLGRLA